MSCQAKVELNLQVYIFTVDTGLNILAYSIAPGFFNMYLLKIITDFLILNGLEATRTTLHYNINEPLEYHLIIEQLFSIVILIFFNVVKI